MSVTPSEGKIEVKCPAVKCIPCSWLSQGVDFKDELPWWCCCDCGMPCCCWGGADCKAGCAHFWKCYWGDCIDACCPDPFRIPPCPHGFMECCKWEPIALPCLCCLYLKKYALECKCEWKADCTTGCCEDYCGLLCDCDKCKKKCFSCPPDCMKGYCCPYRFDIGCCKPGGWGCCCLVPIEGEFKCCGAEGCGGCFKHCFKCNMKGACNAACPYCYPTWKQNCAAKVCAACCMPCFGIERQCPDCQCRCLNDCICGPLSLPCATCFLFRSLRVALGIGVGGCKEWWCDCLYVGCCMPCAKAQIARAIKKKKITEDFLLQKKSRRHFKNWYKSCPPKISFYEKPLCEYARFKDEEGYEDLEKRRKEVTDYNKESDAYWKKKAEKHGKKDHDGKDKEHGGVSINVGKEAKHEMKEAMGDAMGDMMGGGD